MFLGIDTGGTFTDFVLIAGGQVSVHKVPSTPDHPERAVLEGWRELAQGKALRAVTYGTTVATNALLEKKGARVALVTTQGFEDLIEIGRQTRPELYVLEPAKPDPLVPRSLRFGVSERVLPDGKVLLPLTRETLARMAARLKRTRVESVAVCLLHAYANPAHENKVARALKALGLPLSLSHRIVPEHREYERLSTTVVNAYVAPVIARHMVGLEARVGSGSLRVMQSNGGAMTASAARELAVRTLFSGPAGGVVGAYEIARRAGLKKIISLDMGGTSTDVCLLDGAIPLTTEKSLAGVPVKVPMVDIHSVGAGGGSIARADIGGALKVGPESAGAQPGPVCYGRGRDITVTDANLYLGRLDAERFLGGRMHLDLRRTRARMRALAGELGMNPTRAAAGVLQVVNHNMERAIRAISVERGYDPAEFTLVAFGGAAGLHAAEMVAGLRLAHIVIPRWPGLLSAWGMAQTPYARDFARSLLQRNPQFKALEKQFAALVSRGLDEVEREGLERKHIAVSLSVDMRYAGQAYEVTVPWSEKFVRQFHQLHEARFGHANPDHDVEVVALRARLEGRRLVRAARPQPVRKGKGLEAYQGMKQAYFTRGYRRCRTYQRERLRPGDRIVGPSIIYEFSSTVLVPPGWRAEVDGYRNLHLLKRGRPS